MTLPANTKANLVLKSVTGEIYTDFDINFSEKEGHKMKRVGGSNLRGSINGGGVEIALNTISDDIYLRKKIRFDHPTIFYHAKVSIPAAC